MARKTVVQFVSDLSGQELGEDGITQRFSVDGQEYEFDASKDEADGFYEALRPYLGKARAVSKSTAKAGPVRRTSTRAASSERRQRMQEIRDWARTNGYTVSDRGRIAAEIQNAYELAH